MRVRVGKCLLKYTSETYAEFCRLNTKTGDAANASDVSRGVFGANAGVDRLLKFFGKNNIKASFFMPSHTILSFPNQMKKVRDAGHEM